MGRDVASQRFPSLFSAKFASELIFMLSVTLAGRYLNVYSSGWSKVESAMRSTSKQCSVENCMYLALVNLDVNLLLLVLVSGNSDVNVLLFYKL